MIAIVINRKLVIKLVAPLQSHCQLALIDCPFKPLIKTGSVNYRVRWVPALDKNITVIYIVHVTTYTMFRYSSFFLQVWSLLEFLFLYKYREETRISASTGPDSSEEHGTYVDETEESHHIAMYTGNIIDLAQWILVIDQQQNPAISQSTNIYIKPKTSQFNTKRKY